MAEIDISEAKIFFACGALWDACGGQLTPHGITYGTALGDGDGPNVCSRRNTRCKEVKLGSDEHKRLSTA